MGEQGLRDYADAHPPRITLARNGAPSTPPDDPASNEVGASHPAAQPETIQPEPNAAAGNPNDSRKTSPSGETPDDLRPLVNGSGMVFGGIDREGQVVRGKAEPPPNTTAGTLDKLQNTIAGRIGEKAWEGFKEGAGPGAWFMRDAQGEQAVRDLDLYNDYSRDWSAADYLLAAPRAVFEGADRLGRTALEAGIATPLRTLNGAYHAGANAAGQGLAETGLISENEGERAAREIKALPEAFAGSGSLLTGGSKVTAAARSGQLAEDAVITGRMARRGVGDALGTLGQYELRAEGLGANGGNIRITKSTPNLGPVTPSAEVVNPVNVQRLMDGLPELKSGSIQDLTTFAADTLGVPESTLNVRNIRADGVQGQKGVSGNPVYLVRDEDGALRGVIKVFPEKNLDQMGGELHAMGTLNKLNHEHFRSVEALSVAKLPDSSGVILLSPAKGMGMDDMMLRVANATETAARNQAMVPLREAVRSNARALAEMHTNAPGSGESKATALDRYINSVNQIVDKLEARPTNPKLRVDLDPAALRSRAKELIDGVRNNPGGGSLVHADFHPGNVFFDKADGITFIDSGMIYESVSAQGLPMGFPARDFAHFHQKLASLGTKYGLNGPEIDELRNIFAATYSASGPKISSESMKFFQSRTSLGDFLHTLEQSDGLTLDETLREKINDQLKILKTAMDIQ